MPSSPEFETQLDAKGDDWHLRLVYADWLDEHDEPAYAAAQRWMAAHEKRPWSTSHGERSWETAGTNTLPPAKSTLDDWLFQRLSAGYIVGNLGSSSNIMMRFYKSRELAERDLAGALANTRWGAES
jgi:uncharacterized protein (TIGR02996 family)